MTKSQKCFYRMFRSDSKMVKNTKKKKILFIIENQF